MMKNDRPGTGPLEMQRDVMGDEVAPRRILVVTEVHCGTGKSDFRAAIKALLAANDRFST